MEISTSFTQRIKEELCDLPFDETRDKSLLSSFVRVNGNIVFAKGSLKLVLKTENSKIAKYVYSLIKSLYPEVNANFTFRKVMKFYKNIEFLININDGVDHLLKDLEIDFLDTKIPYNLTDKEQKIRGYLAGLFLCTGSCVDPKSSNYHLEVYTNNAGFSEAVLKLIKKVKDASFDFKVIKRRANYVVYLKKSDQISDFLAYMDANNSCLEFENVRVNRDYANISNRLLNMDTYNYHKTIAKGEEQVDDIELIDKWLGIKNIGNEKLRELCFLRKENKDSTYSELADLLSKKIGSTVSKSNINHLFIKIKEMAKGYRHED